MEDRNRGVLFDLIELISVFSNSCSFNRLQALSDTSCDTSGEGLKAKSKKNVFKKPL